MSSNTYEIDEENNNEDWYVDDDSTQQQKRTALVASIIHWENNLANPENAKIFGESCPLCALHLNCYGCVIAKDTGSDECSGTPWKHVRNTKVVYDRALQTEIDSGITTTKEKFKTAMHAELNYLRSLLKKLDAKIEEESKTDG